MENPCTWTPLEFAINEAMNEHSQSIINDIIGHSLVRKISDKIRSGPMANFIKDISTSECDHEFSTDCTSCQASEIVERLKL